MKVDYGAPASPSGAALGVERARAAGFDRDVAVRDRLDRRGNPWLELTPIYRVKPAWRVLVEGRDIADEAGLKQPLTPGATVSIFPPGR